MADLGAIARAAGQRNHVVPVKFYVTPAVIALNDGVLTGSVTEESVGVVSRALVRLYYRPTGQLITQVFADASGIYTFKHLDSADVANYTLITLDPDGGTQYNIAALDRMTPKPVIVTRSVQPQLLNAVKIGAPTVGDPAFALVVMQLSMDGTNGSTTFVDSSSRAITMSAVNGAQLTTTGPQFGTAAGIFEGTGDRVSGSHADLALGTGDFTVELSLAPTTSSQTWARYIQIGANAVAGALYINRRNTTNPPCVNCSVHTGSAYVDVLQGDLTLPTSGAYTHVAVTREAGVWRLFVGGVLDKSATFTSAGNNLTETTAFIGSNQSTDEAYAGKMDNLRITKGLARYTAGFTPPSGPFMNS
jgi:hypothetical protein